MYSLNLEIWRGRQCTEGTNLLGTVCMHGIETLGNHWKLNVWLQVVKIEETKFSFGRKENSFYQLDQNTTKISQKALEAMSQ